MITINKADISHIAGVTAIYNEAVLNTTATFDTEIKTVEDRTQWLQDRNENFPVFVALKESKVVGFAALSRWSDKKAYDITAEISLYILPDFRNLGIGKQLLEVILAEAENTNLVSVIARITEGNEHSIYLHTKNGFQIIGVLKSVGGKFDKLLDVTMLQKML